MTTQQLREITQPLEDRIAALEAELARVMHILLQPHPWWNGVFGTFSGCAAFDEMERFGQEWRAEQNDAADVE
jgi:hypothetical protein